MYVLLGLDDSHIANFPSVCSAAITWPIIVACIKHAVHYILPCSQSKCNNNKSCYHFPNESHYRTILFNFILIWCFVQTFTLYSAAVIYHGRFSLIEKYKKNQLLITRLIVLPRIFYFSPPLLMKHYCTSIFKKGSAANRRLPSEEVDWRWLDSNPRTFTPKRHDLIHVATDCRVRTADHVGENSNILSDENHCRTTSFKWYPRGEAWIAFVPSTIMTLETLKYSVVSKLMTDVNRRFRYFFKAFRSFFRLIF